ncbi:hypothetical protein [Crocosphaera chwakensis]|uniref:Uncharacterized protein n=1 Tax=Crocosphaera chwakensis CCY0110 TaxID=391612 RepID=A3IWH0_9CHRO|nr:hypothetical protein [Crocosphaera chwakensis]EAZ89154.1 hypothetical protein CY0110_31670 [Crocosphaera chwakensis CCY0110]
MEYLREHVVDYLANHPELVSPFTRGDEEALETVIESTELQIFISEQRDGNPTDSDYDWLTDSVWELSEDKTLIDAIA